MQKSALFVPKCGDRIHIGGLPCGVPAEENARGHAHQEGDADGPLTDDERPVEHGGDDDGKDGADDDADDAA